MGTGFVIEAEGQSAFTTTCPSSHSAYESSLFHMRDLCCVSLSLDFKSIDSLCAVAILASLKSIIEPACKGIPLLYICFSLSLDSVTSPASCC